MHTDERVGKLEVKVEHVQSDIAEIKTDIREIRGDIKGLKSEVADFRTEFTVAMEKLRGSQRLGFALLVIVQLLIAAGVPGAIAGVLRSL